MPLMSKFLSQYCEDNIVFEEDIFTRRICHEKEKKLQEFNFKILHGILPCG